MDGCRKRLLIVEDDVWSRFALAATVRRMSEDWDVSTAGTVADGLALLDEQPDCVLLDLLLPDGRGETVLRKVREQNLPCHVIVCTSISNHDALAGLLSLKPDAVFTKPINVQEVLASC
jgi:DNA-binding response OmpR family regulator